MQRGKCSSEEPLQIAEKRREVKGKGDRERYTQLSAEFQRIARRDNQTFLNDEYNEVEENNISHQENQRYQRILHARMGTINDRNSKDLIKAEEINKR